MSPHFPTRQPERADALRSRHVAILSGVIAALLLAGCSSDSPSGPGGTRTPPRTVLQGSPFQWSMPARFGQDTVGGMIAYQDSAQIHPASWTVNFDACNIPGSQYTWLVDSVSVGTVGTCKFSHQFTSEGSYDVAVDVASGTDTTVHSEQKVVVQDFLILSIGDSYASGEGNPDVPIETDADIAKIETALTQLAAARQQLQAAQQSLQNALASKGLAQTAYNNAVQLYNQFLSACSTLLSTSCANFLLSEALSFSTLDAARSYFNQIVTNTQQRLTDAENAVTQAQQAVTDAQNAVANLQSVIATYVANNKNVAWHSKYSVENYSPDDLCHRSADAASAQAALALEQADPHTSVTFVHLACSGAKMAGGGQAIDQQIRWANQLIGNREIDAVVVSIGGNDAGFSKLATACVEQQPCYSTNPTYNPANLVALCAYVSLLPNVGSACVDSIRANTPQQSAKQILDSTMALLPGRYQTLATTDLPVLQGLLRPDSGAGTPAVDLVRDNRVYVTEYGNLTRNDAGAYCTPDATDPLGTMVGVTPDEMQWLDQTAEADINGDMQSAASQFGWNFVTGIHAGYTDHGYCAHDHWITRIDETFLRQGDMHGMAHPNGAGQQFSAGVIEKALLHDLYPNGLDAPPRAPDPAGSRVGG